MSQIVAKLPDLPELEYNASPGGAVSGVFCNRFAFHERLHSTAYTQRDYTLLSQQPGNAAAILFTPFG